MLTDDLISRVLPYFYVYLNSNYTVYPDNLGQIDQPAVLLEAFDVILSVYNQEQKRKAKELENKNAKQ